MSKPFNEDWQVYHNIYGLGLSANDKEIYAAGWQARDDRAQRALNEIQTALEAGAVGRYSPDAVKLYAHVVKAIEKARV